ncbi:PIR Superfamily Protein [Plasmodium ovale wallikeri]|uniref:PIR Superfamily Protein n=1 Tax=Plasmodium ovale wallikeri TaxID=864142 RepID=A0A1A9AJH7_PLAOA|nr:PIR Superfamily Protein [Plasmodium ovale wallikeri]SBT56318.1 PIR Superfamily Protein [Plasmodium ovale wallikeri]
MASKEPDIYSFFMSIKEYYGYAEEMSTKLRGTTENTKCYYFSSDPRNFGTEHVKDVCVKFIMLYNVIYEKRQNKKKIVNDNDFAFLNYWLNSFSKSAKISPYITVNEFQKTVGDREQEFATFTLEEKLYDMKDEDYDNMNLLNELQYNYGEIFKNGGYIVKGDKPCIGYFEKFINTYKNCIIKCPDDDTSFCRALKYIKEEYKQKLLGDDGISEYCIDREKLQLPSYSDVSAGNNITMVGTVLGPSFGTLSTLFLLYKFTPLGQWILAKIGTNKGAYNNLYETYDKPLPYNSYNEYINSDYNEYHISYDSVANS